MARRRLLPFIKRLDSTYVDDWVHHDICKRLEKFSDEVAKGMSPRLMLLMPPRHGKSRIASMAFPAWHLGRYPNHEFISASYNVGLAMGFSRKAQAIMEDPRYPFDQVKLDPNNKSAESWGLQFNTGGYVAAGVGGGITGKGAHILSIDDPIKNHEEADSLTVREALWDWYGSTAYTRLAPGGGVLVIQTCWHDDDLAGRLQQAMAAASSDDPDVDRFEIIKYPAVAEADEWIDPITDDIIRIETKRPVLRDDLYDDVRWTVVRHTHVADAQAELFKQQPDMAGKLKLLRVKGEALTSRYNLLKLARIRKTLSNRYWSALYQQNPVPDDGSFFTRDLFKRAHVPEKNACNVFMTWDFAITEKQHNDYTVGGVAYQDEDDMLHDVETVRFKSADAFFIVESIISMMKRHRTTTMRIGFEHGQIFLSIESLLKKRMREERLFIPYETLTPVTDKKVRASPLQGRMQQGRYSFNDNYEAFPMIQNEMLRFPNGVHDDIVDQKAWMARLVEKYAPPRKFVPKSQKSWKDKIPRGNSRDGSHLTA